MKITYLTVFIFLSQLGFSQNFIYKGDKQYLSTQTWMFALAKSNLWGMELNVSVAKAGNGGYLMLSVGAPQGESISNSVFIILNNGESITLSHRVVNDYLDERSQVLYSITQPQFEKLKSYSISKIRFFVKGQSFRMGGSHSASNVRVGREINTYDVGWDTAKEISEL